MQVPLDPSNPNANRDQILLSLVVAMGNLTKALNAALPVVQSIAGSATAGSATLPANPAGFLNITLPNGQPAKVPFYNP